MLDVKWLKEHMQEVEQIARQKRLSFSAHAFMTADQERKEYLGRVEALRAERNRISRQIAEQRTRTPNQ
jgi:seryl-tRNA synthetase